VVGLYAGAPLEYAAIEEQGSDAVPASTGEVLGAAFGQGLAANLLPRMVRADRRHVAETGIYGIEGYGVRVGEPEPTLDPETANAQYGIKGALSFDKPVAPTVAQDLHDAKRAQIERDDTIARREGGLLTGGAARFTANIAAGFLDPLNVALGFVPLVGPARYGRLLEQAGSATARATTRAGIGAAEGAAGMAAVQPLEFYLSRDEMEDYTMADALRNIAMGAVVGGGLHVGLGAVADRVTGKYRNPITQQIEDAGPEARETALQGALAQTIEGRPVDVASALDAMAAARAERDLLLWARRQQEIDRRADTALAQITAREGSAAAEAGVRGGLESRLTDLQTQARELEAEFFQAHRQTQTAIDAPTIERLAAVDREIAANPRAARLAELEAERRLLTEGARTTPEQDLLERERAQAQATGLAAQLGRVERSAADAERQLARSTRIAVPREQGAQREFSVQAARIDAQQRMVQELAARTIRRLAGHAGATLDKAEAAALARRVLAAPPDQAPAITREIIDSLAGRGTGRKVLPPEEGADISSEILPLRQIVRQSVTDMAAGRRRELPEDIQARADADEIMARPSDELQSLQKQIAEMEQQLAPPPVAPRADGAQPTAARAANAEETAVQAAMDVGEARARAAERAAVCIQRGG
jgi:hypothetical protein